MSVSAEEEKKDWSATQYLKFGAQRTRPVYDLVAQITPLISSQNPRIFDLGCGPGNSTQVLSHAFPGARITGVDTSADMLAKANATFSGGEGERVDFAIGDVSAWTAPAGETADLLFSNAVFHWLRSSIRIPTLVRLFESLRPGGVLAFQVPDNYHQPSHASMRATASLPGRPWSPFFADTKIGSLEDDTRPDLDPIEPPSAWIDALAPLARDGSAGVDVWRTEYQHVLADAGGIVEWVKGTGLQPFLHRIGDKEGPKEAFLREYERALGEAYMELGAGGVCLGYPRLFVVAVRG